MEKTNEKIDSVIESILFVAGTSIKRADIQSKLELTDKELNASLSRLQKKYSTGGIKLLEFNDKLQFSTNSDNQTEVAICLNPLRERALSKAMMETLSIVAYKQPVTRLDIEEIRGVSSDYAVQILLEHNLIAVVGRKDAVGKPLLFGTTDEFLKRFNLHSLADLPGTEELLSRIQTIRTEETDSLYREFDVSSEEIIPESIKRKVLSRTEDIDADAGNNDFV